MPARLAAILLATAATCGRAEPPPPAVKPAPGPAPAERTDPPPPKTDPAEEAAGRRRNQAIEARDHADRLRATFESAHRPGHMSEAATKDFNAVVQAYRAAIDVDPRGEIATYCRQRLAGAYTYAGDFEAGLRVHVEAANAATGAAERVRACQDAGYHCLQAMHDPAGAMKWFERARVHLAKIEDPAERAKWAAASDQAVARCEREMKEKDK